MTPKSSGHFILWLWPHTTLSSLYHVVTLSIGWSDSNCSCFMFNASHSLPFPLNLKLVFVLGLWTRTASKDQIVVWRQIHSLSDVMEEHSCAQRTKFRDSQTPYLCDPPCWPQWVPEPPSSGSCWCATWKLLSSHVGTWPASLAISFPTCMSWFFGGSWPNFQLVADSPYPGSSTADWGATWLIASAIHWCNSDATSVLQAITPVRFLNSVGRKPPYIASQPSSGSWPTSCEMQN